MACYDPMRGVYHPQLERVEVLAVVWPLPLRKRPSTRVNGSSAKEALPTPGFEDYVLFYPPTTPQPEEHEDLAFPLGPFQQGGHRSPRRFRDS